MECLRALQLHDTKSAHELYIASFVMRTEAKANESSSLVVHLQHTEGTYVRVRLHVISVLRLGPSTTEIGRAEMAKRVLKWEVPVDDKRHKIGPGPVVHIATQYGHNDLLTVWTEEDAWTELPYNKLRTVQVFGTGHPYEGKVLGTVVITGGHLVWHVVDLELQ